MIVTDIEATGLDAEKCSILSIGAVNFDNPTEQFYEECRAFDGATFFEEGMVVNGFSVDEATDPKKQSEAELVARFAAWVAKQNTIKIIAGQFVVVDIAYLQAACARAGMEYFFPRYFIDLHSVSYAEHLKKGASIPMNNTKPSLRLDETLKYLGLPEEPKPHIAINGAKLEAEAFSRIIYGKQLLEEYKKYPLI